MTELSVLPGRARFYCNKTYKNKELSKYIDIHIESLYGVKYCKVNHTTGTILVLYDESKINLKLIKNNVEQVLSSEINYDDKVFDLYVLYYNKKHKKEIVKNNFIRSMLVYLFFKIKKSIFGKFFLSGNLAVLEIASLVTIIGGYSLFRSIYTRSLKRIYPHPDVILKAISLILTISRESTEGLFLILLIDFADYAKATTDVKSQFLLQKSMANPLYTTWVIKNDGAEMLTSIKSLKIGSSILVHQGEVIPVDGEVISGEAVVNNIYYTGQPSVSFIEKGNRVYEGIIIISGELKIRVLNKAGLFNKRDISIEELNLRKNVIKYQERALPFAAILAVLNYLFTDDILNALSIILVLCPAASELALGKGINNYMYLLNKHNIYVKNPNTIEKLANIKSVVFDKTGTLTYSSMNIASIESFNENYTSKDILKICTDFKNDIYKKTQKSSPYTIRKACCNYSMKNLENSILVPSKGINTKYNGHKILIGNDEFIRENNIILGCALDRYLAYEKKMYRPIFVCIDSLVVGLIVMKEDIRKDARILINELNAVDNISLLTGDCNQRGKYVANELGIKNVYCDCNNEEKSKIILKQKSRGPVMMVGDGINDILSMRLADVSVSFAEHSSDNIKFNSDYIIFDDDIKKLNDLIVLSNNAYDKIKQNVTLANLYGVIFGTLAFLGKFDVFAAKSIDTINSIFVLIMNERIKLS